MEILNQKLEVLHEAYGYMQKLYSGIEATTTYLRQGELTKGYQLTADIVDGLQWLMSVFEVTAEILTMPIEIDKFNETNREMIEAMENQDTILLADLLEYEVNEQLEKWYDIIVDSYNAHIA